VQLMNAQTNQTNQTNQANQDQTRISLQAPTRLVDAAKKIARMRGITLSLLIRQALTAHLRAEAAKLKAEAAARQANQTPDPDQQP